MHEQTRLPQILHDWVAEATPAHGRRAPANGHDLYGGNGGEDDANAGRGTT